MTSFNLDDVSKALDVSSAEKEIKGVSFENKNLKLDTVHDAKLLVDAIDKCQCLEYLNLAGNTLGVDASEAVAKALENHPEFKRALWKDLFTGRLKDEIPKSLKFLGAGLVKANARLIELDLSDNAFGPIGVEGLASLLSSSSCFQLRELRLNNNGLGIGGGKLLAKALLEGHARSSQMGAPLALRVFIAGRNRLENEGAKALANVFSTIGTLEEIAMPQNGIYHVGISALADAFAKNPELRVLNLNDNTIGPKGSVALAVALRKLHRLQRVNLGDCLLKTRGAISLAAAFSPLAQLEEVLLDYNEIQLEGGVKIGSALAGKPRLKTLGLDGNAFGEKGVLAVQDALGISKSCLQPMDNNESADEDEEDSDGKEDDDDEEEDQSDEAEEDMVHAAVIDKLEQNGNKPCPSTVAEFLTCPSGERLLALGENAAKLLLQEAESEGDDTSIDAYLNTYMPVLMKVCALAGADDARSDMSAMAAKCGEMLLRRLFEWRAADDQRSPLADNALLVHLGLIKSEERKYRPPWDTQACMRAVQAARREPYFPRHTGDCIDLLLRTKQTSTT